MAGVTVTRINIPFESAGEASRLWGWFVEAPGEAQQRAEGPITFVVPSGGAGLNVAFRQAGNSCSLRFANVELSRGAGE